MTLSVGRELAVDENNPANANIQIIELQRALQNVKASSQERVSGVEKMAKEQAAGAGESDLRRLRRQFSSLKNTFMLYHTKEHFIDGLLDDLPDGSEDRKLQGLEEQVQSQGAKVKSSKQQNAKTQAEIAQLITEITDTVRELEEEQTAALAELEHVEAGSAVYDQSLPPIEEGVKEEDCEAELASETGVGRQMEAAIAAHEAEVAELQAAINSEQQEVQALRVQVEMLRSSSQQKKDGQAAPERFAEALEWCSEVTALINTLVGVSIRRIEEDQLTIGLITHADPGCDANLDAPPQRWEHELALMLEPGKADVANASLQPPDVDISDIAAAAEGGARSLSFVVREVHARLADQLSRAADIGGTQPQGSQPESLPADVHT